MNPAALRSIEGCQGLGANGTGRHLILGGPANGGPLEKQRAGEKFSLYGWSGNSGDPPVKLLDDLRPDAVQPEGLDLIVFEGETRVLFVEDRFFAAGYGTRNAIHWPVSILGNIP